MILIKTSQGELRCRVERKVTMFRWTISCAFVNKCSVYRKVAIITIIYEVLFWPISDIIMFFHITTFVCVFTHTNFIKNNFWNNSTKSLLLYLYNTYINIDIPTHKFLLIVRALEDEYILCGCNVMMIPKNVAFIIIKKVL